MIAKEWRGVRLQLLGAACLVLLIAVFAPILSPYDLAVKRAESNGFVVYNCVALDEDPPSKCPEQAKMKKNFKALKSSRTESE